MKKETENVIGIRFGKGYIEIALMEQNRILRAKKYTCKDPEGDCRLLLKNLARQEKQKAHIAFVLPEEEVVSIENEMPVLFEEELEQSLPYEFKNLIPASEIDAYEFDFRVAKVHRNYNGKEESFKIEAIAIKKETLKKYENLFSVGGHRLVKATTSKDSLNSLVLLKQDPENQKEKNSIFIRLDREDTTVYVFGSGECLFTRQIDMGSFYLVQKGGNREEKKAELANEIFRAIDYFHMGHLDVDLKNVYLYGPGLNIIEDAIRSVLEEYHVMPIADFIEPDQEINETDINDCAEAIGAAIFL